MNVLSVDFDWIMQPCIEAYNHISQEERMGPLRVWEKIHNIIPGLNPECDLNKFQSLYFFLLEKSKFLKVEDIFIGMNHDQIYGFLHESSCELNIYNIDHHHDMGYPRDENDDRAYEDLSVANWAYYIEKEQKLSSYTWIHNNNSVQPSPIVIDKFKNYSHSTDLDVLENIQFDKIFVCASWEWVPPKYEPLFDILVSAIDKR